MLISRWTWFLVAVVLSGCAGQLSQPAGGVSSVSTVVLHRPLQIETGWARARLGDRVVDFSTTGVDLSDPLAEGLFDLESGRLPEAAGDVVVNGAYTQCATSACRGGHHESQHRRTGFDQGRDRQAPRELRGGCRIRLC